MKKILILGAGVYQTPLIKKAKEMGMYTIVVSVPGNYPGFDFADKVLHIDTTDKETILKYAMLENIDGVVVSGTDVAVPTQGYICDALNLKGPSYNSAILSQNKSLMKKAFVENNVRCAKAEYVNIDNEYPEDICEKIGYPVIFKSIDSSGSRGITRVNSKEDITYAYQQVQENTKSDIYLIEKYLEGEEFGAQAFVCDGELKMILPHGDYVFHGDTGVPIGHYVPYEIDNTIIEDAKDQLNKAVRALGLDNCAINADFMLCDGKTYVLEIGARAGATCLVEMTALYYGFDYYEKIIQAALGEHPDFTPQNTKRQPNVEMLYTSDKTGTIVEIPQDYKLHPNVVDLSFDYAVGDKVKKFKKGPDRIGQIIVIGDTVEEAKTILDETMKRIRVKVEEEGQYL